jgi:hypothetical protein
VTLNLLDQFSATQQPTLQNRVTAASYNAAITALSAAAPAAPTTQAERDALIAAILKQPNYAMVTFIGFIVSDPTIAPGSAASDITDAQINGRMTTAVFDSAAHRLFAGAGL